MNERTLSERVERIEKSLCIDAFATGSSQQYAGCDRVVWTGENSGENQNNGVISTEAAQKQHNYERSKTAEVRDRTSLEEILQQLTNISEFGEMTVGRLEDMADRVYGPMPQEASGRASASAPPEPLVDRLFLACNRLGALMSRFESAQSRVCRIA